MITKDTPDWAIAKIGGIRAEKFVELSIKHFKQAKSASAVMHNAYRLTHVASFLEGAKTQEARADRIKAAIKQNFNLYCIIKRGYSLN